MDTPKDVSRLRRVDFFAVTLKFSIPALCVFSLLAVAGCGQSEDSSDSSADPTPTSSATAEVKLDPSCPATAKTDTVPERVVTMDAGAAAILIELGLGDKVVGTAGPDFVKDFDGDLRKQLDGIPVIDKRQGSTEAVLTAEPDLATSISPMSFGRFDGTPTVEVLAQNDIAAIAACDAVQDGPNENIDATYRYIASLAKTFEIEDKGEALIQRLQDEAQKAESAGDKDASVLLLSQVPAAGTGVMTSGGSSFANGVVTMAGGTNIAEKQQEKFVKLSAEEVSSANPDVIVVISGFSPQSDDELKSAIVASPLLASSAAVKNQNVVVVPQRILQSPSLLNAKAIAAIAEAVEAA